MNLPRLHLHMKQPHVEKLKNPNLHNPLIHSSCINNNNNNNKLYLYGTFHTYDVAAYIFKKIKEKVANKTEKYNETGK